MITNKSLRNFLFTSSVLILAVFLNACCFKLAMRLKEKNKTSYVFNKTLAIVRQLIVDSLGHYQYRGMSLNLKGISGGFGEEILNDVGNKNDAYLYSYDFIGKSAKYYSWWGRLNLGAEFHIHLDSIGKNQTKVTINSFNLEVVTGIKPALGDNLTLITLCTKTVPPSTVEEYEILLKIGAALREKNMPVLRKPKIF